MIMQMDSQFNRHCREPKTSCKCREMPVPRCRGTTPKRIATRQHRCGTTDRRQMPVVLLVEYRDTVHKRLARDLYQAGFRVIRAVCATDGIIQYLMHRPDLVIANVDLPDQSGWLLTAKLCVNEPPPHVWLYKSEATRADAARARFLGAEELLVYQSLEELSDAVFAGLAGDTTSYSVVADRGRLSLDTTVGL